MKKFHHEKVMVCASSMASKNPHLQYVSVKYVSLWSGMNYRH